MWKPAGGSSRSLRASRPPVGEVEQRQADAVAEIDRVDHVGRHPPARDELRDLLDLVARAVLDPDVVVAEHRVDRHGTRGRLVGARAVERAAARRQHHELTEGLRDLLADARLDALGGETARVEVVAEEDDPVDGMRPVLERHGAGHERKAAAVLGRETRVADREPGRQPAAGRHERRGFAGEGSRAEDPRAGDRARPCQDLSPAEAPHTPPRYSSHEEAR